MIERLVKLTINPDKVEEFIGKFDLVKHQIRNFNGCRRLELLSVSASPAILFTYSQWESAEALESYLNSELFKSTWTEVKPLFESRAEAWTLEKLQDVEQ